MKFCVFFVFVGVVIFVFGFVVCFGFVEVIGIFGFDDMLFISGFVVDENILVFGVVFDLVDIEMNYQLFMDYIVQFMGKIVEYYELMDYVVLIEVVVVGKVDVVFFFGFIYVIVINNGVQFILIFLIVIVEGQEFGYYLQVIVFVGSDIKSIEDFKGKKVCFVDLFLIFGYFFLLYNLFKVGIDFKIDIIFVFVGKYDVSVQKVGEVVECEVGFVEDLEVVKFDKVEVIDEMMVFGVLFVYLLMFFDDVLQKFIDGFFEIMIDDIIVVGIDSVDIDVFCSVFYVMKFVDDVYYDLICDICKEIEVEQCQG